jgi:hypothetical protein
LSAKVVDLRKLADFLGEPQPGCPDFLDRFGQVLDELQIGAFNAQALGHLPGSHALKKGALRLDWSETPAGWLGWLAECS